MDERQKSMEATEKMQPKDGHLLVSVMPEAFRGKDGLTRKMFDQPIVMAAVETVPTPRPVPKTRGDDAA